MTTRWGIVSTVKAPLRDLLDFVSWHLEAGAHRIYLYFDAPDAHAQDVLQSHPKVRVTLTDNAYWAKRGGRPERHQPRQCRNARHANNRRAEVDWLCHIDVDEFLMPAQGRMADHLAALPATCLTARVRPVEALAHGAGVAPDETAFKAFYLDQKKRQAASIRAFPTWGPQLSGGFLSHVAGKLFFRTGLKGLKIRIHNVELDGVTNPGQASFDGIDLLHMHAKSWDDWYAAYAFRHAQGSYRPELKAQARSPDALSLHALFAQIEETRGLEGLRAFYDEVCVATPDLCARLEAEGLLRRHVLGFAALRAHHFPDKTP